MLNARAALPLLALVLVGCSSSSPNGTAANVPAVDAPKKPIESPRDFPPGGQPKKVSIPPPTKEKTFEEWIAEVEKKSISPQGKARMIRELERLYGRKAPPSATRAVAWPKRTSAKPKGQDGP